MSQIQQVNQHPEERMTLRITRRTMALASAVLLLTTTAYVSRGANLVQYWHFEEVGAGAATNVLAAGNPATLVNADTNVCWVAGDFPYLLTNSTVSINLDGVDDFINLGNLHLNGSATLAFWIKPAAYVADMRLFSPSPIPSPYGGLIRIDPFATGTYQVNNGGSWLSVGSVENVPVGQWTHVAFSYGLGLLRMYVNGALAGTISGSFPFDQTEFCLGQLFGASGKPFSGAFDELSIWDGPLSASSIQQLAAGVAANTVVDLPPLSGTAKLVQYFKLDDGAGSYSAANSVAGGNIGNLVNIDPGIAWITSGLPAPLAGDVASLAFVPPASNRVDLGNFGLVSSGTISLWLKPLTNSGDTRIYGQTTGGVGMPGAIGFVGSGALQCYDGAAWMRVAPDGAVPTNQWTHLAVAYSQGVATAFINGVPQISARSGLLFDTNNFGLGSQFLMMYGRPYYGEMDDVSVWDQALSLTSIRQLAAGVSPLQIVDVPEPDPGITLSSVIVTGVPPVLKQYFPIEGSSDSTNLANMVSGGTTGYLMNYTNQAPSWTTTNVPSQLAHSTTALYMDGYKNYANLKNLGLSGSGTISMWINPSTLAIFGTSGGGTRRFISPLTGTASLQGALGVNADGSVWVSGAGGAAISLAPAALSTNRWYHIAVTYAGGLATMFIDGLERWTGAAGFGFATAETGLGAKFANNYGSTFCGLMDEAAFWNGPLSAPSIAQLAAGASPTNIVETGEQLMLSWPTFPGTFVLQQTASLSGGWFTVSRTPVLNTNGTYNIAVPLHPGTPGLYYRLKKF